MSSSIIEELAEEFARLGAFAVEDAGESGELFHYTSAGGLIGVVEKQVLWATNLGFVNDTEELRLGMKLVEDALVEVEKQFTDRGRRVIIGALRAELLGQRARHAYAVCFSKKRDQLSQWRGYAQNGSGYVVGLDRRELERNCALGWRYRSVEYDRAKQSRWISGFLHVSINTYLNRVKKYRTTAGEMLQPFVTLTSGALEEAAVGMKDPGFAEEGEVRLYRRDNTLTDVCFRESRGAVVPYIPVGMRKGSRMPITRIVVGPNTRAAVSATSAKMLLEKSGYEDVPVEHSSIPYQG